MSDRSLTALTKALLALSPLEFETFVYELVRSVPNAENVVRNVRFAGTEIDIKATLDGQEVVFESKRLAEIQVDRADAIVGFANRAKAATQATRFVLVLEPARFDPRES